MQAEGLVANVGGRPGGLRLHLLTDKRKKVDVDIIFGKHYKEDISWLSKCNTVDAR